MTSNAPAAIPEAIENRRFKPSNADFLKALAPDAANAPLFGLGLPTPKLESWKYTNLTPTVKKVVTRIGGHGLSFAGAAEFVTAGTGCLPAWAQEMASACPPGREDYGDTILWHAGAALGQETFFVDIPANVKTSEPLIIRLSGEEGAVHAPRVLVRLGKGAELTIIEEIGGKGGFWALPLFQMSLGDGAKLHHARVQVCPEGAISTPVCHAVLGRGSECYSLAVSVGASVSRNQFYGELRGEEGRLTLNGVNLLRGSQSAEAHIVVRHSAENCFSMQTMKSVLEESARGAFQGTILVDRIAQKTDAHQLSNAIVLGEGAEMNTRPELEIYADDVKCSHGATTGELDEESLFYLRSRGIPAAEARRMLIEAFIRELVEAAPVDEVRERCLAAVAAWLLQ